MDQRLILVNLLVQLGVAAAVASALVRSVEFKKLLFRESRSLKQRIYLVLWIGIPIALGVWIRFIAKSFFAGDLSFETTILLGVVAGRFNGALGGALIALPAVLHGEWATLPFNLLCGVIAGQLRRIAPDRRPAICSHGTRQIPSTVDL
jgi:two-component system LytT family sensor kinase